MFLGFFKWTLLFFGGLWPTVPEALGSFTRSCRLKLLMFSGTFAHCGLTILVDHFLSYL